MRVALSDAAQVGSGSGLNQYENTYRGSLTYPTRAIKLSGRPLNGGILLPKSVHPAQSVFSDTSYKLILF